VSLSGQDVEKTCSKCGRAYRTAKDFLTGTGGWQYCSHGHLWFACSCGAQLMLTKGRFDWFSPTLLLSPTATAVFKGLAAADLPHVPAAVLELQRLLRDDASTPAQLANGVKAAPFLAIELLRLANNMRPTGGKPLASLDHAIVFVGRKAVADLARAAAVRSFRFKTRSFHADDFWRDAMRTAKIAEHVARAYAPQVSPDEAYIAGFLCNIGKVVAAICWPEATDRIHTLVTTDRRLPHWRVAEAEVGSHDHCVLGEIGAVIWGLPDFVKLAASRHHTPPRSRSRAPVGPADIATLANQLSHWVQLCPHRIDEALMKAAASAFGLDDAALQTLVDQLMAADKAAQPAADSIDRWLAEISGK
jgi:HD-like signal output (HDOD) protein